MKKLKEQDKKVEYDRQLRENFLCSACLEQQRIQRKIDEKTHNERLLESMIIELVCEYFQHTSMDQDGDDQFCKSSKTHKTITKEKWYILMNLAFMI